MVYPQPVFFTGRFTRYFTPLPIGRWLLLIIYWIIILAFLWQNTIIPKGDPMYPYRWDTVGYRAAWVSVTQVPFLYLLSCKFNPITLLTGISYERFNWLHRWVARTLWLTVVVHWAFFYHSWDLYDIVTTQMNFQPMIKWGFGAWGVMTWMILTGFGFFRNLSYEFFVLQHIAGAAVFLWLLFVHVPTKAAYNIWIAVAFLAFDWGARILHGILQNTHVLGRLKSKVPGYSTRLEPLPGGVVRVTVEGVDFSCKAGQHVFLNMPGLRPFESHPYTIANVAEHDRHGQRPLTMLVQARAGFSRTLWKTAVKSEGQDRRFRSFLSGPWGTPPVVSQYETVVLIACSSGASFIMPLLQDLVRRPGCVRNVELHWIIREEDHFSWYEDELIALIEDSHELTLKPQICVHVTQPSSQMTIPSTSNTANVHLDTSSDKRSSSSSVPSVDNEKSPLSPHNLAARTPRSATLNTRYGGRPTLDSMIRPAVENAVGETAVIVCGSTSITAQSRTYVAALSDERAVHKGTGAQGIYLFTETYGW
jgi:NAD(P)H-flavin reductase